MKKGTRKSDYTDHFHIHDQSLITETKETAKVFVNVGYNLAKEIVEPTMKEGVNENNKNSCTIFLKILKKMKLLILLIIKNKQSTDYNVIDMALIKHIIDSMVKPLTHISTNPVSTNRYISQPNENCKSDPNMQKWR